MTVDLMDRKPYRTGWGLLGEWWCVPVDMDEREQAAFLDEARGGLGLTVQCPLAFVRDRMFGGFGCGQNTTRRHVFFSTGCYTFLGENGPLDEETRQSEWAELLTKNVAGTRTGDGPFCEDFPEPTPTARGDNNERTEHG